MTFTSYTGDGATTQFDITFSYDDAETVYVSVDGIDTPFQFINPSRVELDTAPPTGSEVLLFRRTDVSTPAVDFNDGAIILADDLDLAVGQARNRVQEMDSELVALDQRALKLPFGESYTFPPADQRSQKVLSMDTDGLLELLDKDDFRGPPGASTLGVGPAVDIPNMTFPAVQNVIETTGYYSDGDWGFARYKRGSSASAGSWQDANGNHWVLQPNNGIVYIEQLGAKPEVGNIWSGYTFTGNEMDVGPIINDAFTIADIVDARYSRAWQRFGIASQVVVPGTKVLGNKLSPSLVYYVVMPNYQATETQEGAIFLRDTRGALNGFTISVATELYDPELDDPFDETLVPGRVSGIQLGADTNQFKQRVWNVDVTGGYAGMDIDSYETDFKNVRVQGALIGYINRSHDNEWSATASATECKVGFRNFAGFEGTMHCVRNVTNFDLRGGYPNSGFLFDDTPVRVGIRAQDLNDADVNVYHTKVGGWGRDELTEDAVYFELIDSKRNTFRHVGNFRDPGNIDQSLITFIRFADTKAIGSGQESHLNTFEGLTLGDTQVADATNERQAFMQRWLNVRGTYAADYNTATHFLAVRPTDAGAGATNGGQPFEMYLPFEQSFRAGQSMRIMGYLHARATAFSDYIGRFVIRVPLGSDGGGTKVTLTELDTVGPVDWTGIGLGSPTFDADSMSVSTTYTSPTSSYSRARLTVEAVSII